MELFYSDKYFVLQNDNESLWVNRENGVFASKTGRESVDQNPTLFLIGKVYGFIGTLRLGKSAEPRLVFVRSREQVCKLKEHDVFKITSVISVPLESECEVDVESCSLTPKHENVQPNAGTTAESSPAMPHGPHQGVAEGGGVPGILWNKAKIPACPNSRKYGGRVDRTERRLLDEFYKMFLEADSFYYSMGYDIFNSLQRHMVATDRAVANNEKENTQKLESSESTSTQASSKKSDKNQNVELIQQTPKEGSLIWKTADERFFWNHHMLSEILDSPEPQLHKWAIAIMQGSIQHQICQLDPASARVTQNDSEEPANLELVLISRRSRYRAGTRYLKRGVDEDGKVANYVETEQIMIFRGHMISFVQTRGSVPVFWSQPGYKYRPPIRLDKTIEESFPSFEKHMNEELKYYGSVIAVNLVEKNGKEKVLEEAYRKCILTYDSEKISYVTFDFHDKCRGLKFDNVKLLTEGLADMVKNMGYCWVDSFGVVMQQTGVFRVNCVDCLDRTNVVQNFLAKDVLSNQLSKVGLLMPEIGLCENVRKRFLDMWANNGDIISKQYAGTNALKGDFTRTGERRFAGVMRDGMNSANRYLNNRLKDGTRQACIDLILGVRSSISEEELTLGKEAVEEKELTTDLIMQMIEDVKHTVVPVQSVVVGSWGLVNAKTNEAGSVEIDTVLVLTEHECFIAIYDCSLDFIASSTRINLNSLTSLEIFSEPVAQHNVSSMWGLFQGSSASVTSQAFVPSLKLHFIAEDDTHDFFHFRSSNLRFFNNCLTPITHPDEMMEALKMLAETLKAAVLANCQKVIPVTHGTTTNNKTNQRSVGGINSWIPRWNSPAAPLAPEQTSTEPLSRKFTPASMQRFAPSFLKKKRNTAQPAEEEIGNKPSVEHSHDSALPQSLKIPITLYSSTTDASNEIPVVIHQARTPMETTGSTIPEEHFDLFIPSCGIVSLATRPQPCLQVGLASEYLGGDGKSSPGGGLSPVTPIMDAASQDVTPTSSDTNNSLRLHIPQDLLQRHRHSLPTNSLSIISSPCKTTARSTTPEIKITEEPAQSTSILSTLTGSLSANSNQKRMSRSSEDVNKVAPASTSVKMFNTAFINKVPVSLKNKLVPTMPQDSRSTSDQDIFSSLVNMKGSHSESAIKDGNNSQAAPKVFAPLGKLARGMQNIGVNYLDPRKLRDTLRQPRQDNVPQEDPEMLEKIKSCKSLIIDI